MPFIVDPRLVPLAKINKKVMYRDLNKNLLY